LSIQFQKPARNADALSGDNASIPSYYNDVRTRAPAEMRDGARPESALFVISITVQPQKKRNRYDKQNDKYSRMPAAARHLQMKGNESLAS
jgi:hypothetical protein